MNVELGQVIDSKYKLVRLLGSGGMGAVYEGENLRIRRRVAIKMLHAGVSSQAETVTRFEREAQAAGTIGSEHICEVLDLGVLGDGTRYMVMEYLDGETLGARIKRFGRLTPLQSVPLLGQVLEGLAAAHAAGIIHRDLKPDNVWIVPQKGGIKDFVKILDFGVSKFSQGGSGEEMNMTRAGAVVGTPYYMSPEQARGMHQIDQRTDIYALGVVLYQATTGQVPYQAETFNELLFKIVLEVAPPPQTYVPNLDPDFAAIITRAMAREPGQRYGTCAEFRDALLYYQHMRTPNPGALPPAHAPSRPQQGIGGTRVIDMAAMTGPAPGPPQPMQGPPMPWGNASSSGAGPAVAFAPMPQLGHTGPGVIGGGPMATSNSWGNASSSGAGAPAQPKSKAGLVIGVAAAALVIGGGVAAAVFFGHPGALTASAAPAESTAAAGKVDPPQPSSAPAAPSASASAAATTAPSAAPTTAASAESSAQASAAPAAATDDKLGTIPGLRGGNKNGLGVGLGRGRPAAPAPAAPTPKAPAPAPKPAGGDLGY